MNSEKSIPIIVLPDGSWGKLDGSNLLILPIETYEQLEQGPSENGEQILRVPLDQVKVYSLQSDENNIIVATMEEIPDADV